MQCMETNIETEPGDIDRPMWSCRRPHVVEFKLEKVPNYIRKWIASEKKSKIPSRKIRSRAAITIQNAATEPVLIAYTKEEYFYALGSPKIIRYTQ